MRSYIFVLAVLIFTTVSGQFWDCRNPQLNCVSPGTCDASGVCTGCTDSGYDCGLDSANIDKNDCATVSCSNGGTCTDATANDTSVTCYCPPEYMGDTCETPRFSVVCHLTSMGVSVNPAFTPNGGIYVFGHPDCKLSRSGNGPYTKTLDHVDATCGTIAETTSGTKKTWERKLLVQEDASVVTDADFIVKFTCTFDGETLVSHTVATVNIDDSTGLGEVTQTGEFGKVTLTASPAAKNLVVGEEVTFTLTGDTELARIRIEKIVVSAVGATKITIFENGCPLPNKQAFIGVPAPATDTNTPTQATAKLLVVKFTGHDELIWSFTVKACLAGDNSCDAASCAKRRRRSAGVLPDNSTEVVNYRINVVESHQNLIEQQRSSGGETECVDVNKMTAAVVAMAVACFILLVICLVFIVRVVSSRRNVDGSKQNLYETGSYGIPRMVAKQ